MMSLETIVLVKSAKKLSYIATVYQMWLSQKLLEKIVGSDYTRYKI